MRSLLRGIVFAALLLMCLVTAGCSSPVTKENFQKIKPGMTRAEVEAILGAPVPVAALGSEDSPWWLSENTGTGFAIEVNYEKDPTGKLVVKSKTCFNDK